MYMYIYVYVYVCVYIYIYIHIHIHIHTCIYIYICIERYIHIYMCISPEAGGAAESAAPVPGPGRLGSQRGVGLRWLQSPRHAGAYTLWMFIFLVFYRFSTACVGATQVWIVQDNEYDNRHCRIMRFPRPREVRNRIGTPRDILLFYSIILYSITLYHMIWYM